MVKQIFGLVLGVCLGGLLVGCQNASTAADAWNNVISHCATNGTFTPKDMVYTGPSNNVGVGAVWRAKQEGGYGLIEFAPKDVKDPAGNSIYNEGNKSSCGGQSSQTFTLKASADLVLSALPGTSAGLSADLNRAKSQDVKVDSWRELDLVEGPFTRWLNSPAADPNYKLSVMRQDARVAYRVIEVTGMTVTFTFDGNAAAEIHAKYAPTSAPTTPPKAKTVASSSIAELGGQLQMELKDNDKLVITAPQPFVIEAALAKYFPGDGVGKGANLVPETPGVPKMLTFEVQK